VRPSIPIRGEWTEEGAGWLERDPVARCGGALDDRPLWMLDSGELDPDWAGLRALENRSQPSPLTPIRDLEARLPFPLRGVDSDNGGEFINHHLVAYLAQRPQPVRFPRARPYRKNHHAHVEPRNWTRVRQHFGSERSDNPAVAPLLNPLCPGARGHLLNHFLPTLKLEAKVRRGKHVVRK
jgi:hypothetical protein